MFHALEAITNKNKQKNRKDMFHFHIDSLKNLIQSSTTHYKEDLALRGISISLLKGKNPQKTTDFNDHKHRHL